MVVRLEGVEERLCEWGEREREVEEREEKREVEENMTALCLIESFTCFPSFLVSNLALLTTVMMNERMISLQSTFISNPSPASTQVSLNQKTRLRASSDQIGFPNLSVPPRFQE